MESYEIVLGSLKDRSLLYSLNATLYFDNFNFFNSFNRVRGTKHLQWLNKSKTLCAKLYETANAVTLLWFCLG